MGCGRGGVPRDAVLMGAPRGPAKREGEPGEQHQSKNWKRVPGQRFLGKLSTKVWNSQQHKKGEH